MNMTVIPSEARDLLGAKSRSLASLGMTALLWAKSRSLALLGMTALLWAKSRSLASLGMTALLLTACAKGGKPDAQGGRVEVGQPAPAYTATSLDGKTVSLASMHGKV